MPVADTELLFALNPLDKKHEEAMKSLSLKGLKIPDTAVFEFQIVLRARGRKAKEVASAMRALKQICESRKLKEVCTAETTLFIRQTEIEEKYGLSYFDSLIAASAFKVDSAVVSDDSAFDRVQGLKRIPLGRHIH